MKHPVVDQPAECTISKKKLSISLEMVWRWRYKETVFMKYPVYSFIRNYSVIINCCGPDQKMDDQYGVSLQNSLAR